MSKQPVRDPFLATFAGVAFAVLCLAAFTPAAPTATTAPAAAMAQPAVTIDYETSKTPQMSDPADLALVGMSIANYDR